MSNDLKFKQKTRHDQGINLPLGTVSTALALDSNKNIVSSSVTATELGYLSGASSNLQTQIDALSPPTSTSFSIANNQTTFADISGLVYSSLTSGFTLFVTVGIDATTDLHEAFLITGINQGATWEMDILATGFVDSQILFNITSSGQLQYKSGNYSGFVSGTINYQATTNIGINSPSTGLVFVSDKRHLPAPSSGVITLSDNTAYYFSTTVDLAGDRLVCGINTTLLGSSSENCRIKSTGLIGTALITSVYSLPIRNITIEADIALNLDGDGTTTAIDWAGVNFTDCATIGTIKDYSNFILLDSAFLNSGNLTFDGTIGTIGMFSCLFNTNSGQTAFILPSTLTVSRRFRIIYSSFVTSVGETSINIDASAIIPSESYILDTCNFSGGGTYLAGITETSNKSLFSHCVGITNTSVNGQLYMNGNATATTLTNTTTFVKVAGTTSASVDNAKYTHANNRLTNDAVIERKYLIQASVTFTGPNNNIGEFGFYDSKLAAVRSPSRTKSTISSTGRAENVAFFCVVSHKQGDYIEIHCRNTSTASNLTITDMNVVITELN